MKMIKVSDDVHEVLKGASADDGISISETVTRLLSGRPKRADLDIVLDQLKQLFDAVQEVNERISGVQKKATFTNNEQSHKSKRSLEDEWATPPEDPAERMVWLRKKQQAILDTQKDARMNPEDYPQE